MWTRRRRREKQTPLILNIKNTHTVSLSSITWYVCNSPRLRLDCMNSRREWEKKKKKRQLKKLCVRFHFSVQFYHVYLLNAYTFSQTHIHTFQYMCLTLITDFCLFMFHLMHLLAEHRFCDDQLWRLKMYIFILLISEFRPISFFYMFLSSFKNAFSPSPTEDITMSWCCAVQRKSMWYQKSRNIAINLMKMNSNETVKHKKNTTAQTFFLLIAILFGICVDSVFSIFF